MLSKGFQGIVGLTMFLFLSNNVCRKAAPFWVRAFSSGTDAFTQRSRVSSQSYAKTNRDGSQMSSFLIKDSRNSKCYSTSTSLSAGVVEQDLDSALDDLLQGTFDEAEEIDVGQVKDSSESVLSEPAEEPAEDVSVIVAIVLLFLATWIGFSIITPFHFTIKKPVQLWYFHLTVLNQSHSLFFFARILLLFLHDRRDLLTTQIQNSCLQAILVGSKLDWINA
jgi:hypothetical protein